MNPVRKLLGRPVYIPLVVGFVFMVLAGYLAARAYVQGITQATRATHEAGWSQVIRYDNPLSFLSRCYAWDARHPGANCMEMYRYFHAQYAPDYRWPLASAGAAAVAFLAVVILPGRKPELPAEGALAAEKDLKEHGYLGEGKLSEGAIFLGLLEEHSRKYVQLPPKEVARHVLVEAGTGEGKTSTYVMSLAISAAYHKHGLIAWDQKYGEPSGLVDVLPIFRHYNRPVYTYAPYDPDTPRIPLLDMVVDRISANRLAEALIAPAKEESVDFYRDIDREMFAAVALAISLVARAEGRPARMSEIVRVFNTGDPKYVAEVLQEGSRYATSPANDPWEWGRLIFGDESKMRGVPEYMRSLRTRLAVFLEDENVDRATSRGEAGENLDLATIFEQPSLFYIGLPKTKVMSISNKTLMRMLKVWIDDGLYRAAVENHGGELPYLTHYVLDEFQNFGELPHVSEALALFRSMNVAFHIIIQDRAAIEEIYGPSGLKQLTGNNTGTKIYYVGGLSDMAREELEKWIGKKSIVEEALMRELSPVHEVGAKQTRRLGTKPVYSREEMQQAEQGTVLAKLHYVPYTVYRAVLLDDPRHPFHRDWKAIQASLRTYAREWEARHEESSSEGDPLAGMRDPAVEQFRAWVTELIKAAAPVEVVHGRDGSVGMARIVALPQEALADEWTERGWLALHRGGWALTRTGLELLDEDALRQIQELAAIRRHLRRLDDSGKVARGIAAQEHALVLVDEPSSSVFVHVSTPLARKALDSVGDLIALGVKNPNEWRVLPWGRLAYGMLPESEVAKGYGEVFAKAEGGGVSA